MDSNVTDEEIKTNFLGTNFGRDDHRQLLATSVLKRGLGYHCGQTISTIMAAMDLVSMAGKVTVRGREFCYNHFHCDRSG